MYQISWLVIIKQSDPNYNIIQNTIHSFYDYKCSVV